MTTVGVVVMNSSPLIALEQIGQLDLLDALFGSVLAPPAVAAEVAPTVFLPPIVQIQPLARPLPPKVQSALLGRGESEAIGLAVETAASWLILDDRPARRLAEHLSLPVIGTLGILAAAKRQGKVPAVRPLLDALITRRFRISPKLYEMIIAHAGEAP